MAAYIAHSASPKETQLYWKWPWSTRTSAGSAHLPRVRLSLRL